MIRAGHAAILMNLSVEQMRLACFAIQRGLSCAAWEGTTPRPWWELSVEEQEAHLAVVRAETEKTAAEIAAMNPHVRQFNQQVVDRIDRRKIEEEEAQHRQVWLVEMAQQSGRKGGNKSGFKMALNDTLSMASHFEAAQRLAVQRRLAAAGLPQLELLLAMLRRKHEKIVQRGRVRNEEEYYLVREILSDLDYPISDEARGELGRLAAEFEPKHREQR